MMSSIRSSDLVEYIWPCGHHQDVRIEPAPAIPFAPVQFPLPLAKPVKYFTEFEKGGIPGLRRCCRCGDKYHLFRIPEECKLCGHSFRQPCADCTIISVTGSREIATVEFRVTGEFDQTPVYWRCRLCEDINPFEITGVHHHVIMNKFREVGEVRGLRCRMCSERFHESNWVISPFFVYLGTWNGKVVAESGPWHWSLAWHRDMAGKRRTGHREEDCCVRRSDGRRRKSIPWIGVSGGDAVDKVHSARKESTISRARAPTLPTPPQSRSPSPSSHARMRSKSYSSNCSPKSFTELQPSPLSTPTFPAQGTLTTRSKPPVPNSPPPPVPSRVDWETRPLPPVPAVSKNPDITMENERGRRQSRRDDHSALVRDKAPNRPQRLQPIRNTHKTHRRTRSGELPGGIYTPPPPEEHIRKLKASRSQVFHHTRNKSIAFVVPERSPSGAMIPIPEPSPVPKIAIQRSDSVVTSSSCYSNDEPAVGSQLPVEDEIDDHSFILPMSPQEAIAIVTALEVSQSRHAQPTHTRGSSSLSTSASSSVGSGISDASSRSRSNSHTYTPRTPTTPTTPRAARPASRSSTPKYTLFPQIHPNPAPSTTAMKVLRPSASSSALRTPPRTLRASSSSVALRPPPENGYGHLRSRSDVVGPAIRSAANMVMAPSTAIGFDGQGRQIQAPALLYPVGINGGAHRSPPTPAQTANGPPGQKMSVSGPMPAVSATEILEMYHEPELQINNVERRTRSRGKTHPGGWQGFEDDGDYDANTGHERGHGHHGGWNRSRSHSRRQTLVKAFKPKNWF
ncbi:hypothetical protein V8F20_003268 [Naviculisporaceae sp. PSN 640]